MNPDSIADVATILVVDDQRDMVDSTAMLLERRFFCVLKAYSAREALAFLDDHPEIAVLLSDIRMPDTDGFDLLRVVRHRFKSLPVVLMTGTPVTDEDVVPGGAIILAKPFTLDELERAVMERLAWFRLRAQSTHR